MTDVNELAYHSHYNRVLKMYTEICEQYGLEPSAEAVRCFGVAGSFSVKYLILKQELRKLINEQILPVWLSEIPEYFDAADVDEAKVIVTTTLDGIPEESYEIFTKSFNMLRKLNDGHIGNVKKHIINDIRIMSLNEVVTNYDFVFHSKFGDALLREVFEEVRENSKIPPEVKAYFEIREKVKKQKSAESKQQSKDERGGVELEPV